MKRDWRNFSSLPLSVFFSSAVSIIVPSILSLLFSMPYRYPKQYSQRSESPAFFQCLFHHPHRGRKEKKMKRIKERIAAVNSPITWRGYDYTTFSPVSSHAFSKIARIDKVGNFGLRHRAPKLLSETKLGSGARGEVWRSQQIPSIRNRNPLTLFFFSLQRALGRVLSELPTPKAF